MSPVDVVLVRLLRAAVAEDWRIVEAVDGLLRDHGDNPRILGAARAKLLRSADQRGSRVLQRAVAALSVSLEVAKEDQRPPGSTG